MNPPRGYVFDTSALIDLQDRYPRDTFPSLWTALEDLSDDGRLMCPREVFRELELKNVELANWLSHKGIVLTDPDTLELVPHAKAIDSKYPDLKSGKRRKQPNPRAADPWVVALAAWKCAAVVSHEQAEPARGLARQIPDVCRAENIPHLTLPEFFRDLHLRF